MAFRAVFTLAIAIGLYATAEAAILDTFLRQSASAPTIARCKADADCNKVDRDALLLKCQLGVCVPSTLGADCASSLGCSTFTWCGPGAKCARGAPGADCTTWRQCDLGNACVSGKCAAGGLGATCAESYNCAKGSTCLYSKCVPGIQGKNCRTDFDCEGKCQLNIIGNFVSGFCTAPPPPPPAPVVPAPAPAPAPAPPAPKPAAPAPKPVAPAPAPAAVPAAPKPAASNPTSAPVAPAAGADPAPGAAPVVDPKPVTAPTPAASAADAPADPAVPGDTTAGTTAGTTADATGVVPETTPDAGAASAGVDPAESTVPEIGDLGDASNGTNARVCIGASSHVSGVKFVDALHPSVRLQVHPLRMFQRDQMVDMLCHEGAGSRLCASATHIVVANDKHMYMSEFCADKICTAVRDYPLNFKGACGMHLEFMKGVHATQHAATDYSLSAEVVARQECAARDSNRAAWFLSTL